MSEGFFSFVDVAGGFDLCKFFFCDALKTCPVSFLKVYISSAFARLNLYLGLYLNDDGQVVRS